MQTVIGLWYYLLAGMCFVLFGTVAHVSRAVFNVYPDRLSDKPLMDMAISDGYDADDWLFGTEYDEAGFYKLDSGRNLKIAVLSTLALGWGAMLLSTEIALAFVTAADALFAWVGGLFVQRLAEASWW
ncbi:hypothetical protein [Rhizobium sp. LjRoot254]|uniref:hypothetical protein n=1 Tax=Rhizobium sp. LjRoot254 TaxID=3342297 RepID=UPI003ECC816F